MNFVEHAVIYVLVFLKIVLALTILAIVWPLQWAAHPFRCLVADFFGEERPEMPIYPPRCACILG